MKILIFSLLVLLIGLTACSFNSKTNSNDPIGGIEPPMNFLPFENIGLDQARKIAFQKVTGNRRPGSTKQFIAVVVGNNMDEYQTVLDLGFVKKDKRNWEKNYIAILLKEGEKDAETLIKQYNISGFPVSIKESISISGSEIFSEIKYGKLPQVSGKNKIDIKSVVQNIYKKYQRGDKNNQLLIQLRDHLTYLEKSPESTNELYTKITNDYLNQLSEKELSTFTGYRLLKKEAKDIRYQVFQKLLDKKEHYNEVFLKIVDDHNLKNKHDADWIIEQAILKSFQKAAIQGDISLFERTMAFKDSYRSEYKTKAILKAILEFHVKREEADEIRFAALEYFSMNKNWTSVETHMLEASAFAINEVSDQKSEWELAEKWIERSLEKYPNPTNYRLQYDLLHKIGYTSKAKLIAKKIKTFRENFTTFKNLYPIHDQTIVLDHDDITKEAYKRIKSAPKEYKVYYRYIARESSLYKKRESIEPIALLSENANEVNLLTRVHLVTGSILPVTHFRSYYIQSKFSVDGEHLESKYIFEDEI